MRDHVMGAGGLAAQIISSNVSMAASAQLARSASTRRFLASGAKSGSGKYVMRDTRMHFLYWPPIRHVHTPVCITRPSAYVFPIWAAPFDISKPVCTGTPRREAAAGRGRGATAGVSRNRAPGAPPPAAGSSSWARERGARGAAFRRLLARHRRPWCAPWASACSPYSGVVGRGALLRVLLARAGARCAVS